MKKLQVLLLVYSTNVKTAQRGWFRWVCLQYASTSCFIITIIWAGSFSPLLGRTRSWGSVEQPFYCLIAQSCQAVQSIGRSMNWTLEDMVNRFDILRRTDKPQKRPYPIYVNRNGNVWHRCGGSWARPTLFLEGLFQGVGKGESTGSQASSRNSQGVVAGRINEADVSTAAPDRSAVLCCWMDQS